jgi:hypothetical protein
VSTGTDEQNEICAEAMQKAWQSVAGSVTA